MHFQGKMDLLFPKIEALRRESVNNINSTTTNSVKGFINLIYRTAIFLEFAEDKKKYVAVFLNWKETNISK